MGPVGRSTLSKAVGKTLSPLTLPLQLQLEPESESPYPSSLSVPCPKVKADRDENRPEQGPIRPAGLTFLLDKFRLQGLTACTVYNKYSSKQTSSDFKLRLRITSAKRVSMRRCCWMGEYPSAERLWTREASAAAPRSTLAACPGTPLP